MQGPGISDYEVATLADLRDLHVAQLTDRSTCFVISEDAQYRLYKDSGILALANDTGIIQPNPGSPIAGAANARWLIQGERVTASAQTVFTPTVLGSPFTILGSATTPSIIIPEDSTENYTIELMLRRAADGAALYYKREVTVTRNGAAPPLFQATDTVSHENVGGADPWPAANAQFDVTTATLSGGQYYLNVQYTQLVADTTAVIAQARVTRNAPITA